MKEFLSNTEHKNIRPKRVLIIRMSALGDILICTPLIRCLKECCDVEIYVLTKPSGAAILSENPHIKEIMLYEGSFFRTAWALNKKNFYYVADLHGVLRSKMFCLAVQLLALLKGRLIAVGSSPKYTALRRKAAKLHRPCLLPQNHVVERHFKAFSQKKFPLLNIDNKGLDYFEDVPLSSVEHSLNSITTRGSDDPNSISIKAALLVINCVKVPPIYIAIAIGSQHFTKQIPTSLIVSICKAMSEFPVFLVGDKNDIEKAESVLYSYSPRNVVSLCGRLSFNQSASIIRHSSLVISGDSIMMHLAAALNKPLISIWGSTVPELGMFPYYSKVEPAPSRIFEVKDIDCRPCHVHGLKECPLGHHNCMEKQDVTDIINYAKSILR